MKHFIVTLQFLTILPLKTNFEIKDEDFGKSLIYFPIIGTIIGSILAALSFSNLFLPMPVVAAIILIVSAFVTGALHLDGFADTCDGFCSLRSKEEVLEIMRDSRCGAMGVLGLILLILLKFSLIISLKKDLLWRSLILMGCFSRLSQVIGCLLPYSRNEGKGGLFIKYAVKKDIIIGSLFTISVFGFLFGLKGIAIFFCSLIPVFLFMYFARAKIGGMTGDTIGAINEIGEVSTLFSFLIWS